MQKDTAKDIFIIASFTALFSIASSILSYLKYISFHDTVFDLGVSSVLIKNAMTITPVYHKLIYLLMFPVYYFFPSQVGLMVFQDFFVCAGSIPLYFISMKVLGNRRYSVIISIIWLLYFPLAGVQWFDFHFMALFPTLFLIGFAFLVYGEYKKSLAFMYLAGITDLLAPVILIFLVIILMIKRTKAPRYYLYGIIIPVASVLVLVSAIDPSYITGFININSIVSNPAIIVSSMNRKLLYFILAGLPLGLLSFIVPEILLIIPYAGLVFAHNYIPYYQPILYQYPALIASGMFISSIYGLKKLSLYKIKIKIRHIMPVIVAITIITWLLFTPYGNLITDNNSGMPYVNSISMGNYDAHSYITYTMDDRELNSMIGNIPKGSSVAIQNNMPQLTQFYNFIVPMNGYNGSPQYIVTDPYSIWFYNNELSPGGYINMLTLVNDKLNSDNYGILYEESGMIIMEKNYHGMPVKFIPFETQAGNNSIISFLPPGNYSIYSNVDITLFSGTEKYSITVNNGTGYFSINKYITDIHVYYNYSKGIEIVQNSPV